MARRTETAGRFLIVASLAVAGIAHLVHTGLRTVGIDVYHVWAGSRLAQGAGPAFFDEAASPQLMARLPVPRSEVEARARAYWEGFHANPSPFFWAATRVLTAGDYAPALLRWELLSVAGVVAGIALCALVAGVAPEAAALVMAFAGLLFLPVRYDLGAGSVSSLSLLVLALCAALAAAPRRAVRTASDVLLGAAVMFKPLLAAAPPLLVLDAWRRGDRRDALRRAAAIGAGALAAAAAGAAWLGSWQVWPTWLARLSRMSYGRGNIAVPRLLGHEGIGLPLLAVATLAAAALVAATAPASGAAGGSAEPRAHRELRLYALAPLLFVLGSSLVWIHYLVLALPALVLALRPGESRARRWTAVVAAAAVGYVPRLVGGWVGSGGGMRGHAIVAQVGVAVLAAVTAWGLARRRPAPSPVP